MLEVRENPAAKRIPASENAGSEANNGCATEIRDPEYESTDAYSPLNM